jgi:hypothetical protein
MIRTSFFSKNYLCLKYLTMAKVPALNWKIVPVLLIPLVADAGQQKTKLIVILIRDTNGRPRAYCEKVLRIRRSGIQWLFDTLDPGSGAFLTPGSGIQDG